MQLFRHLLIGGLLVLMSGCAATVKPQSDAEYKQSITQAQQSLATKTPDQAAAEFEEIAVRNPSRGEPWSYIAKIRFDEQKYGEAIVAADEALSRDPDDFTAKSVRAVGGLRIAMQSLADLRADALLAGNARTDAVALAAAMRETLGQDVLFPEGRKPPRPRPPKRTDPPPVTGGAAATPAAGSPAATSSTTAPANPAPSASTTAPSVPTPGVATPSSSAPPAGRAPDPFGNLLKP